MNPEFGVCNLSIVPLRTEPSDKSEMCTQLLFGDHFEVLEKTDKWTRIETALDEYEGWIDNKQFVFIDQANFVRLHDLKFVLGCHLPVHQVLNTHSGEFLNLVAGTNLPELTGDAFILDGVRFKLNGTAEQPSRDTFKQDVLARAMYYLNAPYLWGGKSMFGIDCSGFTQMVMRQFGIRIKRDAWQQAEQGELVAFLQEVQPGDLAFFDNDEGRIVHVGIMMDSNRIIHASGRVRIDLIDNQGIFDNEAKRYTHRLRIVKRLLVAKS